MHDATTRESKYNAGQTKFGQFALEMMYESIRDTKLGFDVELVTNNWYDENRYGLGSESTFSSAGDKRVDLGLWQMNQNA